MHELDKSMIRTNGWKWNCTMDEIKLFEDFFFELINSSISSNFISLQLFNILNTIWHSKKLTPKEDE